jgi:hypothetical protein
LDERPSLERDLVGRKISFVLTKVREGSFSYHATAEVRGVIRVFRGKITMAT